MDKLLIQVLGGVIVAILSGTAALLIRRWTRPDEFVLPNSERRANRENYSHIRGRWHYYFVSWYSAIAPDPFWIHGEQHLEVKGRGRVHGHAVLTDHPVGRLEYDVQGEVQHGKLILTDTCNTDVTDFASVIFPDIKHNDILVGIGCFFDNDGRLTAAPVVLSRGALDAARLNRASASARIHLAVPGAQYKLHLRPPED